MFDELKKWRKQKAQEESVPPYIICNDRTLLDIAWKMPHTREELLGCYGVGESKAERYGAEILGVVG